MLPMKIQTSHFLGFRSPNKASYNLSAKHMEFMRLCTQAYKSPVHFMWTTIGFTEKLSIDCTTKVTSHKTPVQQQFDGE